MSARSAHWRSIHANMSRRHLLAGLCCAVIASHRPARAQPRALEIGVQLFTLREQAEVDLAAALDTVATIGYRTVEFAGFFGHSPKAVRAMLASTRLTSPSAHYGFEELEGDLGSVLETALTIGNSYIACPSIPEERRRTLDDWVDVAQVLNRAGERAAAMGLQLAYHNHDFEFRHAPWGVPYDVLNQHTDPDLVKMEVDVYWLEKAGLRAPDYLRRLRGRTGLLHLKDIGPDGTFRDVGSGTIDFARVLEEANSQGVRHAFVEHDDAQDPRASLSTSLKFLRRIGY